MLVEAGVLVAVVTVNTDVPEPVTDVGLKLGVAPLSNPLTVKVTVPLNPLIAPAVFV